MVERRIPNPRVGGSNPSWPATKLHRRSEIENNMAMDDNTPTGTLGIERWVQFAFFAGVLLSFWFLDNLFQDIVEWGTMKLNMPTPSSGIVMAVAAAVSVVLMIGFYRNPRINQFANEVAVELANVTWPTRKETWANTIVVLVVSIIAAVILGVFDYIWLEVTNKIL